MIGEQQVIQSVRVTNSNDFKIVDRFDGVPYEFEPNRPQTIPLDAAQHIFGWYQGVPDDELYTHTQKRFGWNTPQMMESGTGKRYFSKIKLEPVIYQLVEVRPDGEIVTAPELGPDGVPIKPPKRNKMMEQADNPVIRRTAG